MSIAPVVIDFVIPDDLSELEDETRFELGLLYKRGQVDVKPLPFDRLPVGPGDEVTAEVTFGPYPKTVSANGHRVYRGGCVIVDRPRSFVATTLYPHDYLSLTLTLRGRAR